VKKTIRNKIRISDVFRFLNKPKNLGF